MARPIKTMPVLKGKASAYFNKSLSENLHKKISPEEKEQIKKVVDSVFKKSKGTFYKVTLADFDFHQLSDQTDLSSFDCGVGDLNDFLLNDSKQYLKKRSGTTYLFTKRNEPNSIVAFFTISNAAIIDAKVNISEETDIISLRGTNEYPAVLIGRLAVDKSFQNVGIGTQLIQFIKGWLDEMSVSSFRLLILDALNQPKQMGFYTKNGFLPLQEEDANEETRIMYFDMYRI